MVPAITTVVVVPMTASRALVMARCIHTNLTIDFAVLIEGNRIQPGDCNYCQFAAPADSLRMAHDAKIRVMKLLRTLGPRLGRRISWRRRSCFPFAWRHHCSASTNHRPCSSLQHLQQAKGPHQLLNRQPLRRQRRSGMPTFN